MTDPKPAPAPMMADDDLAFQMNQEKVDREAFKAWAKDATTKNAWQSWKAALAYVRKTGGGK